jgi:hypothetical protein
VQPLHRAQSGTCLDGGLAGDYPWSSYGAHAGERGDPLLIAHPEYLALGADPATRAAACRVLFEDVLPDAWVTEIRSYLQQQKVPGSDRFRAWVETKTGHFVATRLLGRPPRRPHCPDAFLRARKVPRWMEAPIRGRLQNVIRITFFLRRPEVG